MTKRMSLERLACMPTSLSFLLSMLFCPRLTQSSLHQRSLHHHGESIPMSWNLCPVNTSNGEFLSKFGASSNSDCMPANVPGTILSILLENGIYQKDPYYETNLESIPDIYDTGPEPWTFYYVANFTVPASNNKHTMMELRSINYQANVWLDGDLIGYTVQGMFQRFRFPLGNLSKGKHHLAILVNPPPHPGKPGGGQGGSTHSLAQDGPISQFTAGWDWIQATPDRNTGLWDKVTLKQTGRLQLVNPFVKIFNILVEQGQADLEFQVPVDCLQEPCNNSQSVTIVQLEYHVLNSASSAKQIGETVQSRYIQLNATKVGSTVVARFPIEQLTNAQLWYPHTHGNPTLYQATMRVRTFPHDFRPVDLLQHDLDWDDQVSFSFGIRKVEFTVNAKLNGLQATINDQKVFLQGGNWIATDQFMRFVSDTGRYHAEVALHKSMGFNMIRVWGGGITERPEFFEACDQLGILVLSDLWMSGDNNGRWAGSYAWPTNHSLYLNAVRDTFLLLRNHPSLVMYSAGNELYPIEKNPPPDIWTGIRQALQEIDPDTFLISSTMTNWTDFDPEQSLCPKDGPYGVMEESFYYERNPGLYDWKNHEHYRLLEIPIAFQPEIGSASFPTLASLRRFMNSDSLNAIPGYEDSNIHPTWQYHNFLGFTSHRKPYAKDPADNLKVDLIYQYGAPTNISEYTVRAQLVQFTQFRTLFESFRFKMFEWYTAVLFWKSQSPWPSLRGGLYDWYLGMTGGYYGVRAALMSGIQSASVEGGTNLRNGDWWAHAQMNLMDHSVALVSTPSKNTTAKEEMLVRVQVDAYHLAGCLSGEHLYSHTMYATVSPNAVFYIPNSTLPFVGDNVALYRITAESASGETMKPMRSVSEYWLGNWTASSSSSSTSDIPVQDLSSLGEWREDTSRHVALDVSAMYCGYCDENDGVDICESSICQAAGCTHSEIAVRLTNDSTRKRKSSCGLEDTTIAFAVWTELHTRRKATSNEKEADTRILPTITSNGLFSILRNETRYVCMDPSLGQNGNSEISKLHLDGMSKRSLFPLRKRKSKR